MARPAVVRAVKAVETKTRRVSSRPSTPMSNSLWCSVHYADLGVMPFWGCVLGCCACFTCVCRGGEVGIIRAGWLCSSLWERSGG
jgi:hypothetical protein